MPALLSALDTPSRSWWSMSSKPSNGASNSRFSSDKPKSKSSLTFNSLASAFGLRPKKQSPSLAIQDPPLPIQHPPVSYTPVPSTQPTFAAGRPPSKSVSSTRSRPDSVEPRTPSDTHPGLRAASRHSLLTLSDTDPFAGRGVVTFSSPTDPSRLSAYSNSSADAQKKNGDFLSSDRRSYASSSSQSHSHGNGNESSALKQTLLPSSPSENMMSHRLVKKRSEIQLNRNNSYVMSSVLRPSTGQPTLHKSGSSSTLTSSSSTSARPLTRPRGMTEVVSAQKSGFFVEPTKKRIVTASRSGSRRPSDASLQSIPASHPISPRVIVRQASVQRISPPSAPPSHSLPPPPQSPVDDTEFCRDSNLPPPSTASSTISFASSTSSTRDNLPAHSFGMPERSRRISDRSCFSLSTTELEKDNSAEKGNRAHTPAPLSPPMTLKKALSHQSLLKRGPLFSSSNQSSPGSPSQDAEKVPHKHRTFPHPRIPIPPIPIALKHSSSSNSGVGELASSSTEQKRSSAGGGRKRLFSGSSLRRPSTSQSTQGEDDSQSIFSMKSDQDMYINTAFFKPWISTQPSQPSFWDEATPETAPNSPIRGVTDFRSHQSSPVSTLGKADFGKDLISSSTRHRGFSVLSSTTMASEDELQSISLSPPPRRRSASQNRPSQRSTTAPSRNLNTETRPLALPKRPPERPSTAQAALCSAPLVPDPLEQPFYKPSSSPPPTITSLPPPPRSRQRVQRAVIVTQPEPTPPTIVSLPPPPTHKPRSKTRSVEKAMHHRSIMKKPSFLEIDDGTDEDSDGEPMMDKPVSSSFLDLARESFDTVRST